MIGIVSVSVSVSVDSIRIPLHGCRLYVNGHVRGLAYWLYYWRVAGAVLIVGGGTAGTWLLITLGLIVDLVLRVKKQQSEKVRAGRVRDGDGSENESEDGSEEVASVGLELEGFEGFAAVDDTEPTEDPNSVTDKVTNEITNERSEKLTSTERNENIIILSDKHDAKGVRQRHFYHNDTVNDDTDSDDDDQSVPNTP